MNHSIKDNLTSNPVLSTSLRTRTLAVLIALITTATAWAYVGETFPIDGVSYKVTSESAKEVTVESCDEGLSGDLTIPETVSKEDLEGNLVTYKVTSISTPGFYDHPGLTSISIPNSVKTIEANTFANCTGLTSITIPSSVTTIGMRAFEGCTGLKKVTIGYRVTSIEKDAFKGCTNLDEVICLRDASKLTWNDYNCDDFKGSKNSKTTVCYVSKPSDYSTTFSEVNVTFKQWYKLEIAGTKVTDSNKADILGDGAASYDPTTNTLTLNKDITTANGTIISIFGITGLTINVPANVKLESTTPVQELINLDGSATITGSGALTLKGNGEYGVNLSGISGLMLDNILDIKAPVSISGMKKGFYTPSDSGIRIYGSTVSVSCTENIAYGKFTIALNDCHVSHPSGAKINATSKFVDANGKEIKAVTIVPDNSPGIFVSEMVFPDENFRNWILSQDYGKSGYITAAGLAGVTSINVNEKSIADLKGIEYFTALKELSCNNNQLTALDVSKNEALVLLNCSNNALSALDVKANTALRVLYCHENKLTALDVSKNMALEEMFCLDNKLTALDVSKNTALTILYCYGNQIRGKGMQTLINSLHSTGGYLCVYTSAATDGNEINTIQVGEAKAKKWTVTERNGSSEVDYAGIHAVAIDETNFPDYFFRENWILMQTFADDNYLNDKEAASVTAIDVSSKGIANLKGIEHFTALKTLNCNDNYLETSTLDLSKNTALEVLDCSINRLNALDVSKNTALKELYCYRNSIRDESMQTLISSLHQNGGTLYAYDTTYDQNEMTTTNVADAKAKKWQVKAWDGSKYVAYAGIFAVYINNTNFPDATFRNYVGGFDQNTNGYLTENEINVVTDISVPLMDITSLKGIEHFTELITLDCNSNKLTALDVTKNTALKNLICAGNQLSDINLSKNTALEGLDCSYNKLTALNVSTNTALTTLSCENNQLTALDVTNNTSLSTLYCYGNKISKGMQALISSLRQNGGAFYGYSSENDDNKITTEQVAAAMKKGWSVFMWDGSDWVIYNGILLGDANSDDKVDVADIVAIVSHQKGKDVKGFSLPAADVNYDGKADGKDIELISKIIMKE